jgi:competence protein ComEC
VRLALARGFHYLLAASLCLGIAAANAVRPPLHAALAAGVAAVAAVLVTGIPRLALLVLALLLAGSWWGGVRLDALDRSVLLHHVGRAGPARVVVMGPARRSRYELRLPARVRQFGRLRLDEAVQLELPPGRAPPQGAVLETVAVVERPEQPASGFDEARWLRMRGIHVILNAHGWRIVGRRGGLGGLADRIRGRLARTLAPGVEDERRAVLAGVVLGEDEGLSEGLRDAFRASGLYHLLAVSGQNVALLAGGVFGIAWLLGLGRAWKEVAVLAAIAAYVLAVGWQPSVVRAGVAGALASLAWLAARERDPWWFLLLGAFVLLAWNPYSLLEPGFQLSFVAVAAIFVGVPRIERALAGYPVPRALALVLGVSLACTIATAPIVWLHFGSVPLYSVVSNVLAAPAVAPALGLAFAAAALEPVLPAAAAALGWLNGWVAAYLAACARVVAELPFAVVDSGRALVVLAGLGGLLWLGPRLRAPRGLRLAALALLAPVLLAAWRLGGTNARPPPSGLRVTFLDVGQGDACLLEVPGAALLVDQGPPEGRAATQLRRLGVRRLSALVLTHPQRDHVGGAADVLERVQVGFVLDPALAAASPEQHAALAEARERGVPVVVARAGDRYRFGDLRISILWPDGPGTPGADPNLRPIVLVASYGEVDVLLTADAESPVTLPLDPPRVEIMKVAHHGSSDDGLPALLERARPQIAVISVGLGNDYGHPTPATLSALAQVRGLTALRTDRDGRITIESDGRRIEVDEER